MTTATESIVRARAHLLGIFGNTGGWIVVNAARVACGHKAIRLQGWDAVVKWAENRASRITDPGLIEVRDGTRIGVPTIDICESLDSLAVALNLKDSQAVALASIRILARRAFLAKPKAQRCLDDPLLKIVSLCDPVRAS